jgi:CubicO group peptidase (beta-lactamase class C family)
MRSLWLPLLFVLLRASRPTEAARAGTTHGGQRQQPPPLLRPSHVGPRTRRRGGRPPCSAVEAFVKEAAEEVRVAFNVTGLSVGVICNHSIVFQGGFGMADKEAGREATEHSLYQIASNTKAFTATLMLQLQEEGKISIDEPLRDASPSFRFFDRAGNEDLTPRDLLSHRTGLPRHDRVTFGSPSRAALMRNMAWLALDKPVRYQPGEYNNMMLAAAGVAEEAVTGQSWEDLVSERIFRPLNMSNSFANWSMVSPGAAALLAQPYRGGVRTDRSNADVAGPCGAIVSSVADFLKWQGMHLRQSARACVRSDSGAPFTNGPISRVTCQTSLAAAAAAAESGPFLLSDGSWSQLLVPNTIFPDFSEFGTYTLGLWWESYAEEFVLHHAGVLGLVMLVEGRRKPSGWLGICTAGCLWTLLHDNDIPI